MSAVFENLKEEYKARVNALREKYVGKSIQEGALRRSLLELYLKHEKGSQAKSQESQKRAAAETASPVVPPRLVREGTHRNSKSIDYKPVANTVPEKAFALTGKDEALAEASRVALPTKAQVNKKAIDKLGDVRIIPEKAAKRRGSDMKEDQKKKQIKSEKIEEEARLNAIKEERERLIREKNTAVESPKALEKQVDQKALEMLGDQKLEKLSKEVVPEGAKVNNKAIHLMGDVKVIPSKAAKRRGSDMHHDQRMAMMRAENAERKEKKKRGMLPTLFS